MALKLSEPLREQYKVNEDGVVVLKAEFFEFNSGDKYGKIKIPSEHIHVSTFKSKYNRNEINRCVNKITHAYLMKIKRDLGIKLDVPVIIRKPDEDKDLWGYCIVKVLDSDAYGDGEVHDDTLKGNMYTYAFTMMVKRAQDRAICNEIGLYSEGFYSESEDLGEDEIRAGEKEIVDYDDIEREKIKEDDDEPEDKPTKGRDTKKKKTRTRKTKEGEGVKPDSPAPEFEGSSKDPDDPEKDNIDDKELIIKKITLLSTFTHMDIEEMSFHAILDEGKDINSIEDLSDLKTDSLQTILEHAEKDMEEEDLKEMLLGVIRDHKTDQKWNMKQYKEELAEVLDEDDPNDVEIDRLNKTGLYHIINEWDLWS
jgi:hypothetical protein